MMQSFAVGRGSAFGAARFAQSIRDVFVYDDFDRSDRFLSGDICPTGQAWALSGTGQATAGIVNGVLSAVSNTYCSLDYGKTINIVEGTFSFIAGGGANDGTISSLVLIADKAQLGLANMLHLLISPTSWTLQKVVAAGAFVEIASGQHTLTMDGTPYHISMAIDGNTVAVSSPDGLETSVTDADISGMAVRYGCWQINPYANAYVGRWNSVGMGKSISKAFIANGSAAPIVEVTQLKGAGISKKQTVKTTLIGGIGWYRISTAAVLGTFAIAGRVKISATIPGVVDQGIEITCKCVLGGGTPEVLQVQNPNFLGQIQYIRLSADADSPYGMGLDIYYANAAALTLRVDFEGYFSPVSSPVVGAVDYADQTYTLTLT